MYRCRSHEACNHRVKIVAEVLEDVCPLYQGCLHSDDPSAFVWRGIHPAHAGDIDSLPRLELGAQGVRSLLQESHADDRGMFSVIPTVRQLENRKSYLVRVTPGGWDPRDYSRFHVWASEQGEDRNGRQRT